MIDSPARSSAREFGLELLDRFGAATLAGLACGFLIGGIGGRLAMFILRLTSSDALHGLRTDDDFTIGEITTSSAFLILVTTLIGTLLAFAYLLVRRWLPARRRPLQAAAFFALVGGAAIIKPDGVDFNLVEPHLLSVVLFIVLPGAYGWAMAASVEWLIDHPGTLRKGRVAAIVLFVAVGFFGLFAVVLALGVAAAIVLGRESPALARAVVHPVVTWAVRLVLLAVAVSSTLALVDDVAEIL